jgi:hypothetical protein
VQQKALVHTIVEASKSGSGKTDLEKELALLSKRVPYTVDDDVVVFRDLDAIGTKGATPSPATSDQNRAATDRGGWWSVAPVSVRIARPVL